MDGLLFVLTLGCALGCGLVAGVFFGFSTFVMKALSRLSPDQGIAAMQAINVAAINPLFMTLLFGTAAGCLTLAILTLSRTGVPAEAYLLAGSVLYIGGTIVVTVACHVPRNERLAKIAPGTADAAAVWMRYLNGWTLWNHVRTIAALGASMLLILALPQIRS
jgi:uncharacterized membrane protein